MNLSCANDLTPPDGTPVHRLWRGAYAVASNSSKARLGPLHVADSVGGYEPPSPQPVERGGGEVQRRPVLRRGVFQQERRSRYDAFLVSASAMLHCAASRSVS